MAKTKAKVNVYEMVTEKIMEKLKEGTVPWQKPWFENGAPKNHKTGKAYRGVNLMLLEPGAEYITFKQAKDMGGKVKKGAKSEIVVFWKWIEKEDENGEKEKFPILRYYRVFNVAKDVEGLEPKHGKKTVDHDPIETCEKVLADMMDKPDITNKREGAWYRPFFDHVNVPPMKDFKSAEGYYSTLFHELAHATGHKSRLNRDGIQKVAKFGSEDYSKEELVAEMTASMLAGHCGIEHRTVDNSAAYIKSWLNVLKDDTTMVVKAAAQAQKAADYILNITHE